MQQDQDLARLLDSRAVATYLGVSEATLSRIRQDRSGPPFVLVRGLARYRLGALEAWMHHQERANGAA